MAEAANINKEFMDEIKALWSIERMLTDAMPGIIEKATHEALKMALAHHLAETDQHRVALELICKQMGFDHEGNFDEGMKEILEDGEKMMMNDVSDQVIIECAREVEQYEIEAYRYAADVTQELGYLPIASRLRLTLEEEQQADGKLKFLATEVIPQQGDIQKEGLNNWEFQQVQNL